MKSPVTQKNNVLIDYSFKLIFLNFKFGLILFIFYQCFVPATGFHFISRSTQSNCTDYKSGKQLHGLKFPH